MPLDGLQPPVRVVQLLGAGKAGGAETFFVRLMAALARQPDEIALLPVVRTGSWAAGRLKELGIPFETARFGGWWDVGSRWRIARLVRAFAPDVVMAWMNRAAGFVPKGPWARSARLGGYYKFKYYRRNVDYLVGNMEDLCAYLRTEWDVGKVACIGNFIPRPGAGWRRDEGAMRAELGVDKGVKVMMMAARLHPVKGWDVALRALARLVARGEDVVLVALGEGLEQEALARLADELGVGERVRWVGWADSVTRYAAVADVWVVASRHEPLGNSVLDAWAHGVPVVATRSVGPAALIDESVSGFLVEVDDAEGLAGAIGRVLQDGALAARLVGGGTAAFEKDFCEEVIVQRFIGYYRQLKQEGGR